MHTESLKSPVLSPLVGMNKDEIITIARQIETFEHSIQPYPDCCSFMIAAHPETRGVLEMVERLEKNITDLEELLLKTVAGAEKSEFSS